MVRKGIGNKYLIYFYFDIVMMLDTHFLWWIIGVCIDTVWNKRWRFRLEHFFGKQSIRSRLCENWVGNLNSIKCIYMGTTERLFNINTDNIIILVKL